MAQTDQFRALNDRLVTRRAALLRAYPFFGRLLLRLRFGLAACGTAYTDMRHIVFDPDFMRRLSDPELDFILLHEVLHCVLHHCTRGEGRGQPRFNLACDIVVNSLILETLGVGMYVVDGAEVMHLTPKGSEGRLFSAEQVYEMLTSLGDDQVPALYPSEPCDRHDAWETVDSLLLDDSWDQFARDAAAACSREGSGIPDGLKRRLRERNRTGETDWRQVLNDFIRFNRDDYEYMRPDRRFQGDIVMPSFQQNVTGERVDRLWFLVDTSGSVTAEALTRVFGEIYAAIGQVDALEGALSFFDTEVSEPVPFESAEDLDRIEPVGGGGTSFHAIFQYLRTRFDEEDRPRAMLIMTDGLAEFPEEREAMGIPVLWIITESDVEPPWGDALIRL